MGEDEFSSTTSKSVQAVRPWRDRFHLLLYHQSQLPARTIPSPIEALARGLGTAPVSQEIRCKGIVQLAGFHTPSVGLQIQRFRRHGSRELPRPSSVRRYVARGWGTASDARFQGTIGGGSMYWLTKHQVVKVRACKRPKHDLSTSERIRTA